MKEQETHGRRRTLGAVVTAVVAIGASGLGAPLSAAAAATTAPAESGSEPMIFEAIRRGDDTLLRSLLRQGDPVNWRLEDGTTPLMLAALYGSPRSVKWLLESGADATATNRAGVTPLLWGAGDPGKVRSLLKHGADPNARSQLGNTPLIAACRHPSAAQSVKLLLNAGADAEGERRKNNRGWTPLANAAAAGNLEVVKLLIERGIAPDGDKHRALLKAVEVGRAEIVRTLLDAGADPNWGAGRGSGHSLDVALMSERPEIARLLLEHGADPTTVTATGKVPPVVLAAFTEAGDPSALEALIARGVDLDAANARGETAYDWARRRGHRHLMELLADAGASRSARPPKAKVIPDNPVDLAGPDRQERLRDAARRSLALLQRSSDAFLNNRESCVSCHHQNLPAVAFGWARDRGFRLDEASVARLVARQDRWMKPRIDRAYQMDEPVPVPPRLIGYGLLGFAALGRPRDAASDAQTYYLAAIQQPDGHWDARMRRPPMGGGEILSTTLALRALQLYPPPGDPAVNKRRLAKARDWLLRAHPQTLQEQALRLLGLGWAGVETDRLRPAAEVLQEEQRDDGGWAQLPGLPSDAWATGQTLVALHVAGGVPVADPRFRGGLEFLLRTQFDDGSWFVPTRTWPFQPHFDSRFPHGRDQWISAGATAWATMAVLLAVEPFVDDGGPAPAADEAAAVATAKASATGANPGAEPAAPPTASPADDPDTTAGVEAEAAVDFATQIKPVLERSCAGCHGAENPKSGFRVTSRQSLLRGGESGLGAIIPGRADDSPLVRQVLGLVEDMEMPPLSKREKYPALTAQEVAKIRAWIDAGAPGE